MIKDQPTMVERVARAMCNQYLKRLHDNETRREVVVEYEWHEWEGEATAAINAIFGAGPVAWMFSHPVDGSFIALEPDACDLAGWTETPLYAAQMKEPGK